MADVILVMKRPGNVEVMRQALSECGISSVAASGEVELRALTATGGDAVVALVDVSGFGAAAWRMGACLHDAAIPFIVLSTPREFKVGSGWLAFGAISVLQKPVAKSALLQLIQAHIRKPLSREPNEA